MRFPILFESYNALKKALLEHMENKHDAAIAKDAYKEYIQNGKRSRPISELWQELDI